MASSKSSTIDDEECIHTHPQCSACNTLFLDNDHVIALTCNEKSVRGYNTYAEGSIRSRELPRREGFRFRREKSSHETCDGTDESVTVHVDCIRLFGKTCSAKDKYRRLWIAGTRLYPWRGAESLMLDPMLYTTTESISSAAGFHKTFLPEVANLIGGHLKPNHPLLRFCKVIQLARYLSLAELGDAVTHPLCEVLSWSRGTSPIFVEQGQTIDRRVRLTIDSRGIKSIDMVSESESSEENTVIGSSRFTHAYIVESAKSLSGVDIEFQLGMSRLHVPTSANLPIWNIPSPHVLPPPAHYTHFDKSLPSRFVPRRLEALDLDPSQTTGVSFFMTGFSIKAIHGHTQRGSRALEVFQEYLRRGFGPYFAWIYIPVAANDKVISIGTVRAKRDLTRIPRHKRLPIALAYSIVLTMKSGKYVIGSSRSGMYFLHAQVIETLYEAPQSEDRHLTLTFNMSNSSNISFIGADTVGEAVSGIDSRTESELIHAKFQFYESLEQVAYAQVFSDRDTGRCSGILLEYEDGIKRALGQCRLGFDAVRCYDHPTKFCYMPITYPGSEPLCLPLRHVYAAFDSDISLFEGQDDAKWEICPMKGILQFVFDKKETVIQVRDA